MLTECEKLPNAETRAAMAEADLIIAQGRIRFAGCQDLQTSLQAVHPAPGPQKDCD